MYCLNDAMIMSGPYNRFATPDEAAVREVTETWGATFARGDLAAISKLYTNDFVEEAHRRLQY